MDELQKHLVGGHQADKQQLRQLENEDEVNAFQNYRRNKTKKFTYLLIDIELYNPHRKDESFKKKIREIRQDVERQ